MKITRRQGKIAIIVLLVLVVYVFAFFMVVGCAHFTWADNSSYHPEYVMFVSKSSIRINQHAHLVFAPLIWLVELTGKFQYAEDVGGTTEHGDSLLRNLWSVLIGK
jgi:hypothetical protein